MIGTALLLPLALAQGEPDPPRPSVVIELETGGRLEGEVVEETADYLELRTGPGTTVGFERSKIASIERRRAAPAPASASSFQPRDEWFVLHDAEGRMVGRMHATLTFDKGDRLRVGEEWEFRGDGNTTEVTLLEVVRPDLTPISCFYHERVRRLGDGRVEKERVVHGIVDGDRLVVDKKTAGQGERMTYAAPPDLRFPLSLLESLRQRRTWVASESHDVFDPRTEQLERREFSSTRRRVALRDAVVDVREVRHSEALRDSNEWLDASSHTLRREVNGPALVAIPVDGMPGPSTDAPRDPVFPSTVVAEASGRFALWLPQPSWRAEPVTEPGKVVLREAIHEASACLMVLDQVDPSVLVDSAADDVLRWLRLVKKNLTVTERASTRVRDRGAVRLCAEYSVDRPGESKRSRMEVYVFPLGGTLLALCFDAPAFEFDTMRADFQRILDSVDLCPAPPSPGRSAGTPGGANPVLSAGG